MGESILTWKTACISFNPQLNERDSNIETLSALVEEAAQQGAKLIVTPEMATTGYHYHDREAVRPFVDTIPGHTTAIFARICRQYDAYVVLSLPEVDPQTDLFYISAALIGPSGWIGTYRKTHQWECEAHWAAPGDLGIPVFETAIGRIAIIICMDSIYFETARLAALQGADILTFPTNSSGQSIVYLQARAESNGLYVISSNRSNVENEFAMIGGNAVWMPDGTKLAEAEVILQEPHKDQAIPTPSILYSHIDSGKFDNPARRRLQERRPELYQDLLLHIAPWNYRQNNQSKLIHAAVIQYRPRSNHNKLKNIEVIESLINKAVMTARKQKCPLDLIVMPELSITGPLDKLPISDIEKLAENINGETVQDICRIAIDNRVHLIFGFPETDGLNLYNTVILVNPAGEIEGHYRKTHLTQADQRWAIPGNRISVCESAGLGRVGLLIGYDAAFPEAAGVLAVQRADLIAIPSSWSGEFSGAMQMSPQLFASPYPNGAVSAWDGIAAATQAYTLVANYIGKETDASSPYLGCSGLYVVDPIYGNKGHQIASREQEETLLASFNTLPTNGWFNQQALMASRKPHLYKPLIMPSSESWRS